MHDEQRIENIRGSKQTRTIAEISFISFLMIASKFKHFSSTSTCFQWLFKHFSGVVWNSSTFQGKFQNSSTFHFRALNSSTFQICVNPDIGQSFWKPYVWNQFNITGNQIAAASLNTHRFGQLVNHASLIKILSLYKKYSGESNQSTAASMNIPVSRFGQQRIWVKDLGN